ncbi:MAG: site-specific integrase [Eubacteriaceae bacterium]|nr:site-specific integrase [Eubacteriaceae bacterium]
MASKTNCTINGYDYYRQSKVIGHKENGDPVRKWFYGKNKTESEKKYKEFMLSNSVDENITFGQMAYYYTYNVLIYDSSIASTTLAEYERAYRLYLKERPVTIKPLAKITAKDIQTHFNLLSAEHSTPVRQLHKFLKKFFAYAEIDGLTTNPMSAITVPVKRKKDEALDNEVITFSDGEMQAILKNLKTNRIRLLIKLAAATGMRIGELLGLKYENIHDGYVSVVRQHCSYYQINNDGTRELVYEDRPPKANSYRDIPYPANLENEIKLHKELHYQESRQNGYESEYVFTTQTGHQLDPRNVRRAWKRFLLSIDVEPKKFHALRATYGTSLSKAGVAIETTCSLMGHKSIKTTYKYYINVEDDQKIKAASKINSLFG